MKKKQIVKTVLVCFVISLFWGLCIFLLCSGFSVSTTMSLTQYIAYTFESIYFRLWTITITCALAFFYIGGYVDYRKLMKRAKKCTKESKGFVLDSKMDYVYTEVYHRFGHYENVYMQDIEEGNVEVVDGGLYHKGGSFYKAEIEYEADGRKLRSSSLYPATEEYTNGSEIMIKYNPDFVGDIVDENAEKNSFVKEELKELFKTAAFEIGILLSSYIMSYFITMIFG